MDPKQLLEYIIAPTLRRMPKMDSLAAHQLLLITAILESDCGKYVHQVGGGPAVSIYQIEPATLYDIYDRIIRQKFSRIMVYTRVACLDHEPSLEDMMGNHIIATMMARFNYYGNPLALPKAGDVDGLIRYYLTTWKPNPSSTTFAKCQQKINTYKIGDIQWGNFLQET